MSILRELSYSTVEVHAQGQSKSYFEQNLTGAAGLTAMLVFKVGRRWIRALAVRAR